ncbi:E3 ubiquitin-protein ligase [Drechslerella dactyloides]|uniref:E3 ubiquitin-protein ligase n=1 Tax=Drechslerella dactyloides TaxID=74499 RepID=A0AAD6IU86_DREDA|nr:E3 ubiquitin-protein ligase [Drechslerella dactyloides]
MPLAQDPTTAAEASQTIYALAGQIGWTSRVKEPRRLVPVYHKELPAKCFICGDTSPGYELVRLSCGHQHCQDCLSQNYQVAINDSTAYPPRCCTELPLAETAFVLTDAQAKAVLALREAHQASLIVTCFSCQGDIYLSELGKDAAYCISCEKLTCTTCKKEMHSDLCPEDPETENLKKLAKEEGWTQCPKCSRVINRISGCNSMTCLLNQVARPPPIQFAPPAVTLLPQRPPQSVVDFNKSRADITFGASLQSTTSLRNAKSYKERIGFRLLRDHARVAMKSHADRTMKLKDVKARRTQRALNMKLAVEILRLRSKMNDLAVIERAERSKIRKEAREYAAAHPTKKFTVTRKNIYGWDGAPVELSDERPIAKRTRSQKA